MYESAVYHREPIFGHLGIQPVARCTLEGVEQPADLEGKIEKTREVYELGLGIPEHVQRGAGGHVG
jgi:hypothetical protein